VLVFLRVRAHDLLEVGDGAIDLFPGAAGRVTGRLGQASQRPSPAESGGHVVLLRAQDRVVVVGGGAIGCPRVRARGCRAVAPGLANPAAHQETVVVPGSPLDRAVRAAQRFREARSGVAPRLPFVGHVEGEGALAAAVLAPRAMGGHGTSLPGPRRNGERPRRVRGRLAAS
jgi:hypothetical protein